MNKLLIISGQTATGKTDVGVYLAKKYNGEIVSFDSRQAYKYLDIITGKDYDKRKGKREKGKGLYFKDSIPIWMYDVYDPKKIPSAYDFCKKADEVITDIIKRGKLPIIVGGTVFYIKSYLEGLHKKVNTAKPDWKLRKKFAKMSVDELQNTLNRVNPKRFSVMNTSDKQNKRRLIRAIEISTQSRVVSDQKIKVKNRFFDVFLLALTLDREAIKQRVEKRVQKRMGKGALEEIENVLKKGYTFSDPGFNTLGYKQLKDFFEKKVTLQKATGNWIRSEIDYVRRQLVFLKKVENVVFIDSRELDYLAKTDALVYKWLYASKN